MTTGNPPADPIRCPAVVIATRNRVEELCVSLGHLSGLPERPEIVVVDNGSSDGTPEVVRGQFPDVSVLELEQNCGAAARNAGAQALSGEHVAFCDDDSWWAPGSLPKAADLLEAYPWLGLVAGTVLNGDRAEPDPTCSQMAKSPLGQPAGLPGPRILGFMACGAVVRRQAFLEAGGFHPRFGVGGEEQLLALSMAAMGWDLAYVDELVVRHHPSPVRNRDRRTSVLTRNHLWTTWLRRPPDRVASETATVLVDSLTRPAARRGIAEALRGLPWVMRQRQRVPDGVEAMVRRLEAPA